MMALTRSGEPTVESCSAPFGLAMFVGSMGLMEGRLSYDALSDKFSQVSLALPPLLLAELLHSCSTTCMTASSLVLFVRIFDADIERTLERSTSLLSSPTGNCGQWCKRSISASCPSAIVSPLRAPSASVGKSSLVSSTLPSDLPHHRLSLVQHLQR